MISKSHAWNKYISSRSIPFLINKSFYLTCMLPIDIYTTGIYKVDAANHQNMLIKQICHWSLSYATSIKVGFRIVRSSDLSFRWQEMKTIKTSLELEISLEILLVVQVCLFRGIMIYHYSFYINKWHVFEKRAVN